jgi:hypothetical protein
MTGRLPYPVTTGVGAGVSGPLYFLGLPYNLLSDTLGALCLLNTGRSLVVPSTILVLVTLICGVRGQTFFLAL